MKRLFITLGIILLLLTKPITAYAQEVTPTPGPGAETIVYVNDFTEEEKAILLDSIQTIRAILVFIVFCIVVAAIVKFLSWFF